MIRYVPVTTYKMAFEKKDEKLPMYVYYTLLGQEYETLRHDRDNDMCGGNLERKEYALDVLETALNGHPEQETPIGYRDENNTRVFNVRFNDDGNERYVRVCFYIGSDDPDVLKCNIQRATKTEDPDFNCTHTTYESAYKCSFDYSDLEWYGMLKDESNDYDDEEW